MDTCSIVRLGLVVRLGFSKVGVGKFKSKSEVGFVCTYLCWVTTFV